MEVLHGGFYAALATIIGVTLVIATGYSAFFFIGTCGLAYWGLTIRSELKSKTDGPLPWAVPLSLLPFHHRWPMLIFDVWTIGISALYGCFMWVFPLA